MEERFTELEQRFTEMEQDYGAVCEHVTNRHNKAKEDAKEMLLSHPSEVHRQFQGNTGRQYHEWTPFLHFDALHLR